VKSGEDGWEKLVPESVAEIIKDRCLFGFPCVVYDARGSVGKEQAAGVE
jgi:hypothetical protein